MTTRNHLPSLLVAFCAFLAFSCAARSGLMSGTPLDAYIAMPDNSYKWNLVHNITGPTYTAYILNMTSQTWLNSNITSASVWFHYMQVIVPNDLDPEMNSFAFLFINGGDNTDRIPSSVNDLDELILAAALSTRAISIELNMIPNQPMYFYDTPTVRRTEDAIIAWTWRQFLNDISKPYILVRFPMVKASIRAMDATQEFVSLLAQEDPKIQPITQFFVAGASKRGWTTWLVGATDPRVIGIAPIVMPILSTVSNINHQWMAYGNWTFAFSDYLAQNITDELNSPQFKMLAQMEDPMSYLYRLDMPKFVVSSCGDEFFLPDDPQFYWQNLLGQKHMRLVPNAEHSLAGHGNDVVVSISAWAVLVAKNLPVPQMSWSVDPVTGAISVAVVGTEPTEIKMWHAHTISVERRDFRLLVDWTIPQPVLWFDEDLQPVQVVNSTYRTYLAQRPMPIPGTGWEGLFVEATWSLSPTLYLKFSTELSVIPNTLPFAACPCAPNTASDGTTWAKDPQILPQPASAKARKGKQEL